jgi:hypothetical protein
LYQIKSFETALRCLHFRCSTSPIYPFK